MTYYYKLPIGNEAAQRLTTLYDKIARYKECYHEFAVKHGADTCLIARSAYHAVMFGGLHYDNNVPDPWVRPGKVTPGKQSYKKGVELNREAAHLPHILNSEINDILLTEQRQTGRPGIVQLEFGFVMKSSCKLSKSKVPQLVEITASEYEQIIGHPDGAVEA